MFRIQICFFMFFTFIGINISQDLSQSVRGTIIDADSNIPLVGVEVIVPESDPFLATTTDIDGNFKIENVPIGRIQLFISYLGYENQTLPNVVINSGKEVILNISLTESPVVLDEVVISARTKKGEALSEMAIISSRFKQQLTCYIGFSHRGFFSRIWRCPIRNL